MPVKIDALPKTSRGREKKYDFSALYDGQAYMIVQGTDFDCEVTSIRQVIYREVHALGKSVRSTETTAGEGKSAKPALAFQVIDEPPKPRKAKATENGDGSDES